MATNRSSNTDGDLGDYFRRLASHPDRNSQLVCTQKRIRILLTQSPHSFQRRDAFKRLLSLINPTTSYENKILVMELIQDFFADFPDMQDEAINLVYDMCEDHDQKVSFKTPNLSAHKLMLVAN